jgi:hypothetical protein
MKKLKGDKGGQRDKKDKINKDKKIRGSISAT